MYRYYITAEDARELDREILYSESRWGRAHAKKYIIHLKAKIESIAKKPYIYTDRVDILPSLRICNYKGSRIIFTIIEAKKSIAVIGFLSSHQDVNSLHNPLSEV